MVIGLSPIRSVTDTSDNKIGQPRNDDNDNLREKKNS